MYLVGLHMRVGRTISGRPLSILVLMVIEKETRNSEKVVSGRVWSAQNPSA